MAADPILRNRHGRIVVGLVLASRAKEPAILATLDEKGWEVGRDDREDDPLGLAPPFILPIVEKELA